MLVRDILERVDLFEARKVYKTEEDFKRFCKWAKRYNPRLRKKDCIETFRLITGLTIKIK